MRVLAFRTGHGFQRRGAAGRRLSLLLMGAVLGGIACNEVPDSDASVTTTDSAGVRIVTIGAAAARALPEWRLWETPTLLLDAGTAGDSTAFARIGDVDWLADGSLIVADRGATQLHVSDARGVHRRTLGRRGEGPEEFSSITSVTPMRGDTLAVFDASLRRLSVWSAARGFVRQVDLRGTGSLEAWPADAWPLHDSLIVVLQLSVTPRPALAAGDVAKRWPMRAQLALQDLTGRVIATSPAFDGMYTALYANGDARTPFSHNPFAAVAGDRVVYGSGERFQIALMNPQFRSVGEIRAPVFDEPFNRSEATRLYDETLALVSTRMPASVARARLEQSFDPAMFPDHRPSIGRVVPDGEGRLWVERFEPMRLGAQMQVPGSRWTVLTADGRPEATLQLPPSTRLESVRGDEVAVVRWDELDVQSVAVYRIRR